MFNPMITILRNYTEIIVFIVTLFVGYCQCAVTITPQNAFVQGGNSLTIIATTDETSITWTYKSGESLSLCSITGSFCVDTNVHNMVLTADATTNTSTITIASVNCSINTAIFIAKTSNGEATANIQVTTPESSLDDTSILSTNSVPSQELSIEVPCVHPLPDVNFTIVREGKPNETIHDVTVSSTSSGCSCTTQATYTIKTTISASRYPGENVQVTANVGQLTPLVIGVVSFTVLAVLVLLIGTLILYEVYGLLISNGLVAQGFLHCLRYYNRKKGINPVSPMTLLAKRGDTVVLEIEGLQIIDFNCQRCPEGKFVPGLLLSNDKLSFSKPITSDDDYGVYQVDILIDCSQKPSNAMYKNCVIPELATNDDQKGIPESATNTDDQKVIPKSATRTDDQKGRKCTFLVKFQWDKEDLVSIQYPEAYFFADKYFLHGVKFTGIQIIIGAAISQLIALIAVSIVLLVVYFEHMKYDTTTGVAVSCALAIVFSLLGLLEYLLTVVFICRRNLKSKGGKGHPQLIDKEENEVEKKSRCRRTFLLFVMLPVALLVLIGIFIINICGGGKDKCGNEEQGTKEKIKMNSPNQKAD